MLFSHAYYGTKIWYYCQILLLEGVTVIKGLGMDIIEIERVRDAIKRHDKTFINKVFTVEEQHYCERYQDPIPRYAGRFAAKEAVAKALGTGIRDKLNWLDIQILSDNMGKPSVRFSSRCKLKSGEVMISISHSRHYATATAIWIDT